MAAPEASASSPHAPDLGRLRIEREAAGARRRSVWPWAVVVLLLGAGAWAFATGRFAATPASRGRAVEVARVPARPGSVPASGEVKANGYVIARRRAALSTVLSGRLVEVNVEEGARVEKDFVVARIQHDDVDAQVESARKAVAVASARRAELQKSLEASRLDGERLDRDNAVLADLVRQAEAEARRAAAEAERKTSLHEKGLVSDDEWDRAKAADAAAAAAVDAAKSKVAAGAASRTAWDAEIGRRNAAIATADAEVAKAQQAKAEADILLEKTYVRAPFAGLVVHKDAELGEVVAATGAGGNSRGSVATIVDPDTLEAQVEMNETRLGTIAAGDRARIRIDAEGPGAPGYEARVRQVWPTADRNKATVEIRVEFVEKPHVVKVEMGVTVTFLAKAAPAEAGKEPEPLRVPRRAVVARGGRPAVAVVDGGKARWVEVATGPEKDGEVAVTSGLAGGETVVLDPPADLADGETVQPKGAR
jgi:RND family efflux transporter MFP subunit